jgi:hypothetical protein
MSGTVPFFCDLHIHREAARLRPPVGHAPGLAGRLDGVFHRSPCHWLAPPLIPPGKCQKRFMIVDL